MNENDIYAYLAQRLGLNGNPLTAPMEGIPRAMSDVNQMVKGLGERAVLGGKNIYNMTVGNPIERATIPVQPGLSALSGLMEFASGGMVSPSIGRLPKAVEPMPMLSAEQIAARQPRIGPLADVQFGPGPTRQQGFMSSGDNWLGLDRGTWEDQLQAQMQRMTQTDNPRYSPQMYPGAKPVEAEPIAQPTYTAAPQPKTSIEPDPIMQPQPQYYASFERSRMSSPTGPQEPAFLPPQPTYTADWTLPAQARNRRPEQPDMMLPHKPTYQANWELVTKARNRPQEVTTLPPQPTYFSGQYNPLPENIPNVHYDGYPGYGLSQSVEEAQAFGSNRILPPVDQGMVAAQRQAPVAPPVAPQPYSLEAFPNPGVPGEMRMGNVTRPPTPTNYAEMEALRDKTNSGLIDMMNQHFMRMLQRGVELGPKKDDY